MSVQFIIAQSVSNLTTGAKFASPSTVQSWDLTSAHGCQPWMVAGVFRNMRMKLPTPPGGATSRTFTLNVAGSPTALTMTFTGAEDEKTVTGVDVPVGVFDTVQIACTETGVPDSVDNIFFYMEFVPTIDGAQSFGSMCTAAVSTAAASYNGVFNGLATWSASVVDAVNNVVPVPGVLTGGGFKLSSATGLAKSRTLVVYKNGIKQDGTGGTVNTTITVTNGTEAQGTFALPLAAGDRVYVEHTSSGSPTSSRVVYGFSFIPTDTLQCVLCGASSFLLSTSATAYFAPVGVGGLGSVLESTWQHRGPFTPFTAGNLHWVLSAAPGGSVSRTLTIRVNSVDSAVVSTITGAATTGSETANGAPVSATTDFWNLETSVVGGSAASARCAWGLALAIEAPAVVLLSVTKHVTEVFVDEDEELDEVSDCTGGGDVAEAENPADGVSLATTTAPLYWMEVTLNDGSPATVYRWAQMAIPYGLPKEARVLRFGTLTRALSDLDGGFESATITSELQDIDGVIRAAWVSGTLRGARVDYYCADLATLQADGAPDRRFRGYISKCEPAGDRTFRLTVEDALTNRLNAIDGQDLQAPTQLIEDRLADLDPKEEAFDKAAPLLFGSISDEFGAWETEWVGTDELDGVLLEWFLVSMAVVLVNEAFLAGLGATADVRVQVAPDAFEAGRPFVPGKPGWIEANDWSVRDGRRWTLVAGRADDPAIILAKEGTIPLVVNVCGLQADQSLSSSPNGTVNSPALALLLYMNNYLVQDALTDFLPILLDDDVPIFDTDSFQAVHDALVAMADSGYEPAIAGAVGGDFQQRSWRDRVAEFCRSFGYDIGINHHGQTILSVLDTTQGGSAFSFAEDTILEGSVRFPTRLPVENEVRFVHTQNYLTPLGLLTPEPESRLPRDTVSSDWLSGMQVVRDQPSIDALGGSPRGRRRSAIQEYTLSRNAAQSTAVAQRRLDLLSPSNGRIEVALSLSIRHGCELELGQVGDVEHWDLPWTGSRRCRVMRLEEDMDGLTITPVLRDSEDLLP